MCYIPLKTQSQPNLWKSIRLTPIRRSIPILTIVQETGSKTIPKKKKGKKEKWLSEEALKIAVKRREAKSKGEKERYTHLKAEFQRITRRDKKAFLTRSVQRNRRK